ncbi:MAG: glyoxalase/bleomycin resistance/dioxygenase family protein [Bacteroidetes bacterium]|nr:glyoxalase/bleomycin resistance/dioxygenase family protein [Bacteroidota bacterium]
MSGPARAGLFIYAKELKNIARFYGSVAGMSNIHETDEIIVLQSPDIQLIVHQIPEKIAADIVIRIPPERREDTALKFFFTVHSIADVRSMAAQLGGRVFNESWQGPGFVVCNAMDPEGNVFHIRENTAT